MCNVRLSFVSSTLTAFTASIYEVYHPGRTQGLSIYLLVLVLFLCLQKYFILDCAMFEWKNFFEVDVCGKKQKLHAFRSPLLELATSGAGFLMKNVKRIYFCGPGKLFLISFITLGLVKMLLYTFTYF